MTGPPPSGDLRRIPVPRGGSAEEGLLALAFPFHVRLDGRSAVRGFGRSAPRLFPGLTLGDALADHLGEPLDAVQLEAAATNPALPVVLTSAAGAMLRCQVVRDEEDLILLITPWLPEPAALTRAGLLFDDFAAHDPTPEYVYLVRAQRTALDDARRMAERLTHLEATRRHESLHDPLTGVANRRRFVELLDEAGPGELALVLIDLDHFKEINDTNGHLAGDEVLLALAQRAAMIVGARDHLCRLGGDEFAVVLQGCVGGETAAERAVRVGRLVVEAMAEPVRGEGYLLTATASVGIATEGRAHLIQRFADVALYSAKQRGRNRAVVFDAQLHKSLVHRWEVRDRLLEAVDARHLSVVFQPIVSLTTGELKGFEALARWHDPELGPIPPDVFIPVAEESGLIVVLGRAVLERSLEHLAAWRRRYPAMDLRMSVNLAPRQLDDAELTDQVLDLLAHHGLPPSSLQLELTESALAARRRTTDHLSQLRDLGVRLAIDDFGSSESTLARLHTIPANTLKIDRAFLQNSQSDPTACRRLLSAVVGIAEALGMDTVAEGIETDEQRELTRDVGCTYGQGFYWSRPMDPQDASAYLAARSGRG